MRDFADALVGLVWQQQRRASFLGWLSPTRLALPCMRRSISPPPPRPPRPPLPRALGCFDFVRFGVEDVPPLLGPYVRKLMAGAPDVPFTHAWVQRCVTVTPPLVRSPAISLRL